ncbi:MAG: energy-coupling factor transporter transmembrane component T, partial [Lachnospiraceae bacterium]|nr:energy-coupling factor transporter transmembrane component T [Lachnospiraceae bacterium]
SMCLRFVPRFARQMNVISDGQKCVGRSTNQGNIVKRIRHGITIFSILVTWALENAIETADSMKCRGYGEKGRTAFSIYRFDKRDGMALTFMAAIIGILIYGVKKGYAYAMFNPKIVITGIPFTPDSLLVFASYLIFCLMPVAMELYERYVWKKMRENITKEDMGGYRLWEV